MWLRVVLLHSYKRDRGSGRLVKPKNKLKKIGKTKNRTEESDFKCIARHSSKHLEEWAVPRLRREVWGAQEREAQTALYLSRLKAIHHSLV